MICGIPYGNKIVSYNGPYSACWGKTFYNTTSQHCENCPADDIKCGCFENRIRNANFFLFFCFFIIISLRI